MSWELRNTHRYITSRKKKVFLQFLVDAPHKTRLYFVHVSTNSLSNSSNSFFLLILKLRILKAIFKLDSSVENTFVYYTDLDMKLYMHGFKCYWYSVSHILGVANCLKINKKSCNDEPPHWALAESIYSTVCAGSYAKAHLEK